MSVSGHHILDSVLIANECLNSRYKSKKPGILCKLDLEKAYYSVDQNFLKTAYGLWFERRMWIKESLTSAKYLTMINSFPSGSLTAANCLQQRTLFPYFSFLVGEALIGMLGLVALAGYFNVISCKCGVGG